MDNKLKNEILSSLQVLGLPENTTKDQILSRVKKLKIVYEDSELPEDLKKLSEIFKASQQI